MDGRWIMGSWTERVGWQRRKLGRRKMNERRRCTEGVGWQSRDLSRGEMDERRCTEEVGWQSRNLSRGEMDERRWTEGEVRRRMDRERRMGRVEI